MKENEMQAIFAKERRGEKLSYEEGNAWCENYLRNQAKKGRVVLYRDSSCGPKPDFDYISMSKDEFLNWLACNRRVFRLKKKEIAEVFSGRKNLHIETDLEKSGLFDEQEEQARK
ncbi:MAG: hypothetical protein LBC64_08110 [Fibromonadaceae bacterium]|jgi:hypothetical protein|nr:hypothetical protein [Fibromonadaceae bacterium]